MEYKYIKWDEGEPNIITISHDLMSGQAVLSKPTRGRKRRFKQLVKFEAGPYPDEELLEDAEEAAYLALGFDQFKGKKWDDVASDYNFDEWEGEEAEELCRELKEVIRAYWSFRRTNATN